MNERILLFLTLGATTNKIAQHTKRHFSDRGAFLFVFTGFFPNHAVMSPYCNLLRPPEAK
jgi:hypothetical protein